MSRQFVYQDDDLIEKPFNWKQIGRLFAYVRPYRSEVLRVSFVMTVFGMLSRLAIPFLMIMRVQVPRYSKSPDCDFTNPRTSRQRDISSPRQSVYEA